MTDFRAHLKQTLKKFINSSMAVIVAVGGLAGTAPLLLSHSASAAPNTAYSAVPFTSLGLTTDRTTPSGSFTVGSNTLELKVDNTQANTSAHFYQTEGLGANFNRVNTVQATLTVPSDWQNKPVDADMWAVSSSSTNASEIGYPIIAFMNKADTDHYLPAGTGFSVYNAFTGDWSTPTDFNTSTGWGQSYKLEVNYNPTTKAFEFYVNDALISSYPATGGTDSYDGLSGVIFDNFNFGTKDAAQNYTVDWSSFKTGLTKPSAPVNVHFVHNGATLASGKTVNYKTDLTMLWDTAQDISRYRITVTHPDKSITTYEPSTYGSSQMHFNLIDAVRNGFFGARGQGVYTYDLQARSATTGLWSDATSLTLGYDTQSPQAQFTQAPDNNSYVNGIFHVEAIATDNVALNGVNIDVRDPHDTTGNAWRAGCMSTPVITHPTSTSTAIGCDVSTAGLAEGTSYYVRVHANDYAGYGSRDTAPLSVRNFTVDRTAPNLTSVTANGMALDLNSATFINAKSGVTLAAVCSDAMSSSTQPWITFGEWTPNGDNRISGYTVNIPASRLVDGQTYSFTVDCADMYNYSALNHKTYTVSFTVDNTRPTVTFTQPGDFNDANYNQTFTTGPTLAIQVTDGLSGVASSVLHVYDSNNKLLTICKGSTTDTYSCDTSSLPNGSYKVLAGATDNTGNNTTITKYFTIDNTPPLKVPVTDNSGAPTGSGSGTGSTSTFVPTSAPTKNFGKVLGATTTSTGTVATTDDNADSNNSNASVKGAKTTKTKTTIENADSKQSDNFLGLGWWWLLIALAVVALGYAVARLRSEDNA